MPDKSVGTVICMDTIEHVFPIFRAFEEMHRILADDGVLVVSSVMDFWIHSHPNDYWRFTPEAIRGLLVPYPLKIIGYQGLPDFPHTVYGVGFKSYHPDLQRRCKEFCDRMDTNLLLLKTMTWCANSLNGKFKAIRKKLSYKVFGPKSEYNKIVSEYTARWAIIGPSQSSRDGACVSD